MADVKKKNLQTKVVASAPPQPSTRSQHSESHSIGPTPRGGEQNQNAPATKSGTNTTSPYGKDGALVPTTARPVYTPTGMGIPVPMLSEFSRLVNEVYKKRPARRQVPKGSQPVRPEFTHHSSDYNIWYHKKLGDRFAKDERLKAATRCCIATDAGYTKADKDKKDTYICIYFARGHCANGAECGYYHRPPVEEDEARLDLTHDVFGRERHRTYRDDMGGVGSFARNNKTLYISNIRRGGNLDEIVRRHFGEWGEMDYVRIIWDKAIAFVRYKLRSSSEFAKEAMQDQSMDGNEIINIRWSNEDPSPTAQERENELMYSQVAQQVASMQRSVEPIYQYTGGEEQVDFFPSQANPNAYPSTEQQFETGYAESAKIITNWLTNLGLEEYNDRFLSSGYYDLSQLAQLDGPTLDAMNVLNSEHRELFLAEAVKLYDYYSNYYNTYYNQGAEDDSKSGSKRPAAEDDADGSSKKLKSDLVQYGEDDD